MKTYIQRGCLKSLDMKYSPLERGTDVIAYSDCNRGVFACLQLNFSNHKDHY